MHTTLAGLARIPVHFVYRHEGTHL